MSLRALLVVVLGLLVASPVRAQEDAPKQDAPKQDAPVAKDDDASGGAKGADGEAKVETSGEAKVDGEAEESSTAKPTPSPDGPAPVAPATPAPVPTPRGQGIVVVAGDAKARGEARNLARAAYKDALLRPRIDEPTARVLAGDPAPEDDEGLKELASTVAAVLRLEDDAVRRRLLGAMTRELDVQRAVLVETGAKGPRARVIEGGRFRGVTLSASRRRDGTWDWSDAVAMLRGLAVGTPVPGPRRSPPEGQPNGAPKPKPGAAPTGPAEGADDDDEFNLLTSPWFWGGLGVVVTVGVTVFVLSRTALNEPDEVMIQGRIAP